MRNGKRKNGARRGARPDKNDSTTRGSTDAPDTNGFDGFGLRADLLHAVAELGFTKPTPIQSQAIPPAMAGKDVLACAMTGSGKTAAFALPILQRIAGKPRGTTRALVLTPTRELAAQIADHVAELAGSTGVTTAVVHGGVSARPQEAAFRKGVDVIAATPGRLLDHFGHDYAKLAGLEIVVLDEADRMLDMGFLPDIRRILNHLPKGPRQTFFFSATMPDPIVKLAGQIMRDPVKIAIERKSAPATGIVQALYPVHSRLKVDLLTALLERGEVGNAIVFCRTKHRSNRLAAKLDRRGFATGRIHGNRSQNQRTLALADFKAGKTRILVGTDVVARGIDIDALDHVVNFDVPGAPEDYIHRVGRTARMEATGDAYTFVSPEEESGVKAIERALGRPIERRTVEGFDYTATAGRLEERGRGGRGRRGGGRGNGRNRGGRRGRRGGNGRNGGNGGNGGNGRNGGSR